ncbi:MAG: hypothetical protein ABI640_12305 [Gammaproteobacteria bacterium]
MKPARTTPAASTAPSVADDSPSEHIYIGSDEARNPATTARTVREQVELRNGVRRTGILLTLFTEGFVCVTEESRGKTRGTFHLDLQYLDPVPSLERVFASRWFYATLGSSAAAALAAFLIRFEPLTTAAWIALGVASLAALGTLLVGMYFSYEKTTFCTIHGRAPVLTLLANVGAVKKFRAFVPVLSAAIEEAAEQIGHDTSAYLRAEMREHYRLRGDHVLSQQVCAESTGRILAQFDVEL